MIHTLPITSFSTLWLPAKGGSAEPAKAKLLIGLHGLGDSSEGYRFLPEFIGKSDVNYLLVNAPDPYFVGYSWFDIQGDRNTGVIRSRKLLLKLFEEIFAQGFKSENIVLFGFSQGAVQTLDLVLRAPFRLAGAVAISGYVAFLNEYPAAFSPMAKQQKIFMDHGLSDPMLPIEATRPQVEALKEMGVSIQWTEYPKDHTIDAHEERRDIKFFLDRCWKA